VSESFNIVLSVDASRARQGLADLQRQVQSTGQSLRSLASTSSGFDQLQRQVNQASGAFNALARSLATASAAARSIAALSSSGNGLSSLSRGAHDARNAVQGLTSALNPFSAAMKGIAVIAGGLSLDRFSRSVLETGNAVTSFKLALDSIATSPREAGDMFDYVAATSNKMGVSIESNLEAFKNLRVSMASLGIDTQRTMNLFESLQKTFVALHTTPANVKRAMYDIQEVFALNRLDAQRVRAISTHIPGFVGALQEALKGKELHAAFREGIPAETIEAVAKILGQQYTKAQEEALKHAQANLAIMSNKFTMLKADVFDNGFDSGLTNFLKEMNSALDGAGFKNLGATIGEGFRKAFAGATMLGRAIIDLREPLAEVLKTLGTFALAVSGVSLLAGAFTLLTSPLGALAALATIVATQWDNLTATFRKAALGATEAYALINGLVSGKGWDESKRLAALAGGEYLQKQAGAQAGENYAESFLARAKALFASVPGLNLDKFNAEWNRLLKESTPSAFKGVSDYSATATRQDEILLRQAEHAAELSNKLKSLREQLLPTTAAFDKLREVLEKVESMRGKKIGGHAIADSELDRMAAAAKENAFTSAFPAASRIRDLSDAVRIDSEALAASGGNKDLMSEEKQFLQERLALKRKGVDLTNEEAAALRSLIHAQSELNKRDGLTAWAESQKIGMDSINSSIGHGLDVVADGLAKIATEGKNIKATMRDMVRSIAADLIRNGIRSMMAEGIRGLNLSSVFGGADSIKAALGLGDSVVSKAQAAVDDAAKSIATSTAAMTVDTGVVYLNGASISGLSSFKPGSSISDAIRPQGVGGIVANNDNGGARLFANNALQEFKSNVRTGGLEKIPANSASLFGAGMSGRQGLGDIGGALKSIPDFKLSSSDSVKAFGQHLHKLAPIAERAGVTPISNSLLEMYKRSGLDAGTIKNLQTVHPDLQKVVLRAKELSGAKFTMNDGQGLRTQAQADENARKGLGIRNSQHLEGTAADVNLYRNGRYIADGRDPAYRQFDSAMQQAAKDYGLPVTWGGTFKRFDADHWQLPRGWKGAHKQSAALGDADLGKQLGDQTAKTTQEIQKQLQAQRSLATESQKSFKALAETTQPLQSFDGCITKLGENLSQGVPATDSFTGELEKLIQKLLAGLGGGGSGGGLLSGAGELLGGLFSEGGYSDSPVSSAAMPASFWSGAPHYAEGTPNTSGGMPAILHDNEAVVPLSRGREIPVRLEGDGVGGSGGQNIVQNFSTNVTARDADSFRRNHSQVLESMQKAAARARVRNG
jgi:hypothetical protein